MIRYLLAAVVVLAFLALVVGAATGRVRARACCAPADPARDLRMRGAFEDEEHTSPPRPARIQRPEEP